MSSPTFPIALTPALARMTNNASVVISRDYPERRSFPSRYVTGVLSHRPDEKGVKGEVEKRNALQQPRVAAENATKTGTRAREIIGTTGLIASRPSHV